MKILFVCQQYIHSSRWINQLKDTHHEVFLFDCLDREIHEDLRWTNYYENWSGRKIKYIKGEKFLKKKLPKLYDKIEPNLKITAAEKLTEIIKEIQPDFVHSLEMQSQTYPLLKVRENLEFVWGYFCWGSDLFLYRNDSYHKSKIQKVLSKLDYVFTDNSRDVSLATSNGFTGTSFANLPGGGGYEVEDLQMYSQPLELRNLILIKGYDHWVGKSMQVLAALELIVDTIEDYKIYVYSAHDHVVEKIKELNAAHDLDIQYSSRHQEILHDDLLKKFGKALIAVGNSVSDGIPNTLLEAIVLGAFPIQSNPGGVTEDYIEEGTNGFLIQDPMNPEEIASKIKAALNDGALLENAWKINKVKSQELSREKVQEKVINIYQKIEDAL